MYTVIETITPELAKRYLERNVENNRKIMRHKVREYVRLMKSGKFILSPQGISFDTNGNLIDGQHRLTAVVESGVDVQMIVCYDAIPETIEIIDTQQPRTLGQRRKMAGKSDSTLDVALAKFLLRYETKLTVGCDDMVWELMDAYGDSIHAVSNLSQHGITNGKCHRAPVCAALWSAYICGVPESTLESFCRVANTGFYSHESQTSAIVFSRYLSTIISKGERYRLETFLMAQEAVLSYVKGQNRKVLWKDPKPVYYNGKPREIIMALL